MRRGLLGSAMALALLAGVTMFPRAGASGARAPETMVVPGAGSFVGAGAPEDLTVLVDDDPIGRLEAWIPQDPGTEKWITLDYGPYLINPGSDLSRMDVEVVGADGYAVGFIPSVVDLSGNAIPSHQIHIHHAHWYWLDPQAPGYHRWIYGTGEERTQGSIMPSARQDARFADGTRYGVELHQGDRLGFLSMLHNKTSNAMQVYLRVQIQYFYGSHDQILEAKKWDFDSLQPILIGSTFNVPHTGDIFDYPQDTTKKTIGVHSNYCNPVESCEVIPGVGQVWTSPWNGTVVIGAGHSHPGAHGVVLSNLGTKSDPCPEDGDRYPGTTAAVSKNITRNGVFPSEEFQMGLSQPAWRMHVRKGDRLVLNGIYDARDYAYLDAMSYFGLYLNRDDPTGKAEACKVELLGRPGASKDDVTRTVMNQKWPEHHAMQTCDPCDEPGPLPEPGNETNVVHIAGFTYLPGNLGMEGSPLGPPVVAKGDTLRFINEDYAAGAVRHSITSCRVPCNGPYTVNYPFHDGAFDSGALGYMWEETYVTARSEPYWEFDTSNLKKGFYSYYCRLHAWMRGGFYIK